MSQEVTSARAAAGASDRAGLAERLGHRFKDETLLRDALTHPSAQGRPGGRGAGAYERLEFLGDRVLGLIVAELLYRRFPGEDEGALAKRLAALVQRGTLARVAAELDLGAHLLLSRGEAGSGGRANPALLADACEAVIGALYLDGGLAAAARFVESRWRPLIEAGGAPPQDPKTALQEWAQGAGLPLPSYETVAAEGPAHDPTFAVEVRVEGHGPERGSGRSKRAAERAAASAMLARLGLHDG